MMIRVLFGSAILPLTSGCGANPNHHQQELRITIGILRLGGGPVSTVSPRMLLLRHGMCSFPVCIQNVSTTPLDLYDDGNSWGDETLKFRVTGPSGKQSTVGNGPFDYTKNAPQTLRLMPGETWAREVRINQREWQQLREAIQPMAIRSVFKLTAVLSQGGPNQKLPPQIWTGTVESPEIPITISEVG